MYTVLLYSVRLCYSNLFWLFFFDVIYVFHHETYIAHTSPYVRMITQSRAVYCQPKRRYKSGQVKSWHLGLPVFVQISMTPPTLFLILTASACRETVSTRLLGALRTTDVIHTQ